MVLALIQMPHTEFDKIKIAETLGLTEEWVKILEQGPQRSKPQSEQRKNNGGSVDKELVARAKEFDEKWNKAWPIFQPMGNPRFLKF